MKRILIAVFSIILLLGVTSSSLASKIEKIDVNVDGKTMSLDKVNVRVDDKPVNTDVPAVNFDGRTLIPIRFVSESLGAEVKWDESTKEAIIKSTDKEIRLRVDSPEVTINGKVQSLPFDAKTKLMSTKDSSSARTMVPLRFVSEILGATVDWIDETYTADIKSNKDTEVVPVPDKPNHNTGYEEIPEKPHSPETVRPLPTPEPEIDAIKIQSVSTRNSENSVVPQIHIEADGEIEYTAVQEPSRLVIDIDKAVIDSEINLSVGDALLGNIKAVQRINTSTEKIVRITIDTNKIVQRQINSGTNSIDVSFINSLEGVVKETIDGREAIVIKNAYLSKTNSFFLADPDRLVMDLRNTNLNNVSCAVATDIVREVRLGQFLGQDYGEGEQVTRVVLDINASYKNARLSSEIRGNDIIVFVDADKNDQPPHINPKPGNGRVIVIDAGHGGSDSGAVSQGIKEKDLALKVSLKTQAMLENLGYKVVMSRTTDVYPSLTQRYQLANSTNADAFLSVHFNSAGPTATGIETLYSTTNSKNQAFAQSIQNQLVKEIKPVDRGLKLRNNLAVLRGTKGISALAELGFISNPRDLNEIKTDSYLTKCAKALTNGIHSFFNR